MNDENACLKELVFDGLTRRYAMEKQAGGKPWDDLTKRAEYELDVIIHGGFANYFLIVADYVNWAREHDIPVGPGRGSAPGAIVVYSLFITDIDPIKYGLLFERFLSPEYLSIPDIDVELSSKRRDEVAKYVTEKYGLESVGSEDKGLMKFDLLRLKTLDTIKRTVELIRGKGGEYADFNTKNIPENDPETFLLFSEGKTDDVFLCESKWMKDILRQTKPETVSHLAALYSLYRPGLMDYLPQFIASKNDESKTFYPAPELEGVLKETYGVIVYQEQVMQIASVFAGYTLMEADSFRRKFMKKNPDITKKEREGFVARAVDRGYSVQKAEEIFELLNTCAAVVFNKSHAVSHMLLAYQSAYLKANFPLEFSSGLVVK